MTGVDENGLGPRLGPLVATAATIGVEAYEAEAMEAAGRALGVADSKDTTAFGKMSRAESLVLAWCEREGDESGWSVDRLLDSLVLGGLARLRAPCPEGGSFAQCWSHDIGLPAFGGSADEGRRMLEGLTRFGVELKHVRSVVGCAGQLNAAFDTGLNKLDLDLQYFEMLLLEARGQVQRPLHAICGMVGGIRKYGPRFAKELGPFEVLGEERGLSAYRVERVGDIRFEVKADARHLPVALASMFGKYLREVWMLRLNRFYQEALPGLRSCSGYHDSVTRGFVDATSPIRRRLGVVSECFERRR